MKLKNLTFFIGAFFAILGTIPILMQLSTLYKIIGIIFIAVGGLLAILS
jgi:hypothetical protein